jgi:hypothetical protein
MDAYKAVVIHNIGIMSLTGFTLILTDGNLWSLLILICLYRAKSKTEEE